MRTGPWPNNSPENNLPPNWDAPEELGIEQIPAYSPQAKGRIERAWRTCQDRLVSELRLARATTLTEANAVLARFCADYNQRFVRPAAESVRDFRSLPRRFDLDRCLALRYQRVVAPDHTVTLGANSIALPPLPGHRGYAGETVELAHHLDGILRVYRGDQLLLALPLPLEEHPARRPMLLTSAQKRKSNPAPHLQPLRPPRFSGRYLIDRGDRVSLQLVRHFLVATT